MCIRDSLKAVTELEAKCFPAAEAAGRAAFFDRLASFPDHFWLLYEDEKLVSMINGMATDEEHLTEDVYKRQGCATMKSGMSRRERNGKNWFSKKQNGLRIRLTHIPIIRSVSRREERLQNRTLPGQGWQFMC